jgi:hypothetical protein
MVEFDKPSADRELDCEFVASAVVKQELVGLCHKVKVAYKFGTTTANGIRTTTI